MSEIAALVSDHLDIWTAATERKNGAGRGGGKRVNLYGIERLRALILDLAVRGKLVSQDVSEGDAAGLLTDIKKGKAALIAAGSIKKPRELEQESEIQALFDVPPSWLWVRLDKVGAIIGGGTPPSTVSSSFVEGGAGIPWLTPADLGGFTGRYVAHGERDLSEQGLRASSATVMPKGAVLFTSRAPIGYVAIAENPVATNQGFKSVVPYVLDCNLYIAVALKAFAKRINDEAPGTTFKEVSGKAMAALPFPLPPLAEQRRIVAKVDELMALCDALEGESAAALAVHQTLVETLLATLVNSADPADLAANWSRLEAHFDTLFTTEASVDALKQTVLELAVGGGLSPANRWPQAPVGLKSGASLQNGYAFKSEWFAQAGIRLLRNINITHGSTDWSETVCLPEKDAESFSRFLLTEGDIVLTLDRPFISTGTKVAQIAASDLPSLLLQRVGRFQLSERLVPEYVLLWVKSPIFSKQIDPGRSNGVPHISTKQVEAAMIYIPSTDEQQRIVAKVDALMAICDGLKAGITDAGQMQMRLADTIVERAAA